MQRMMVYGDEGSAGQMGETPLTMNPPPLTMNPPPLTMNPPPGPPLRPIAWMFMKMALEDLHRIAKIFLMCCGSCRLFYADCFSSSHV
jgi:hypothetical protein